MSLLCLIALCAPPLHFEAQTLDLRAHDAQARQLVLRQGELTLTAPTARGARDAACDQGRWQLSGPLRLGTQAFDATAAGATVCLPRGDARLTGLAVKSSRGRLSAQTAQLRGAVIDATDIRATACACDDPPWHVTATAAEWTPNAGVWLRWPVLRLGSVPVLAAPTWYAPLARRQSGLLAPRLGFDAQDGIWGRLPLFLTLGQSADLTLAPGWRAGPTGSARLRWAGLDDDGMLTVESLENDVRATGTGSLAWGALRLAVDGEATTDATMRRRATRTLAARGRDHLRGQASAAIVGATAGLGTRWIALRDLNAQAAPLVADTWLSWQAPIDTGALSLDSRLIALDPQADGPVWLDLVGRFDTLIWLGALRVRPLAGAATTVRVDTDAPQTGQGWLGADAEVAMQRRFETVTHRVAVRADGRAGRAVNPRPRQLPFDAPLDGEAAGVSVVNQLIFDTADAELQVRWGYDTVPIDPLLVRAHVDSAPIRLDGAWVGDQSHWSTVEIEPVNGWGVLGGHTRLRGVQRWPLRRGYGVIRPLAIGMDPAIEATTVRSGFFMRPSALNLRYELVLDAEARAVLGQWGQASWDGRCHCWRVALGVSHERGRRWPDVMATVQLGAL